MTKLLILGLLDEGPLSGYDIQQRVNRADAQRWGGILPGSIYHALRKLEEEQCITLVQVERTGHRQRAVYRITPRGREQLRLLILDALRDAAPCYPTTLYSGLSLLDKVPREQDRAALEEQRQCLEAEYRTLEAGQRSNEGTEVSPMAQLTIAHMFAVVRLQQQFVEQLLAACAS